MSYNLAVPSTFSTETRSFSGAGDSRRKDHRTVATPETFEVRYVDIPQVHNSQKKSCRSLASVAASNGRTSNSGKRKSRTRSSRTITTAFVVSSTELPQVPKVDDGQIVSFVRHQMKRFEMTWDEVVEMVVALHGSLERAVWMHEVNEAEAKEGLKNAPADGVEYGSIGRKPKPGEEVTAARLGPNLLIRVWPGDFDDCFAFDFVNGQGQYICPPEDIEIYSMPSGLGLPAPVRSIEALTKSTADAFFNQSKLNRDLNWETYVIPQGTTLRIMQRGHEDRFLTIPSRAMNPANILVLQPWAPTRG